MCAVTIALFTARFAAQCGVFTMKTNFWRDFRFAVRFAAPQNARAVTMLPPFAICSPANVYYKSENASYETL